MPDGAGAGSGADRGFALDRFQREAIAALDRGESVLVAAPTGSGKTVVAEHAVDLALAGGGRAFYTTPIKALSNQKYHDLGRRHGPQNVGLLTGDNAVRPDAPVVVMTTEVLRNMLYARAGALDGLRFVVLDEVHYLQDAYRGPVWEEVIIHLATDVRLVCLSATVSNADELAAWIGTVRGPTATVVENKRPVSLENLFAVADRRSGDVRVLPTLVDGAPNRAGAATDAEPGRVGRAGGGRRYATPRRVEVVDLLAARGLLPAIYFIFSRAACDDAVRAVVGAGGRPTRSADQRRRVRDIAEEHVAGLDDADLAVLGYDRWLAALESGVAAHHAGMVPPCKEAVEACFVEGLVDVVFATETLALGINMPARAVVIEKLTKYTGERHEFLTPAQFTQLTGRAGRRGIDEFGTALTLWSPFVPFDRVAELAASRSFRLTSSFHPTYNMAANLVRRYDAPEAHRLLNQSFAQFQADRAVVRAESRLRRRRDELTALEEAARCERGDVAELAGLLDDERAAAAERRRESVADGGLARLRPGDVVWAHGGKNAGPVAVVSVAQRKGGSVRLKVVDAQRRLRSVGVTEVGDTPEVLARVAVPEPYAPATAGFRRQLATSLARLDLRHGAARAVDPTEGPDAALGSWAHPVDGCPSRDEHLRALRSARRVAREVTDLERQIRQRTDTLARTFDHVLQLLESWGYLEGWRLTDRGQRLARIFHESDLLVAECLEGGLLDGLSPAELAGVASCLTYEHRAPGPPAEPWFPNATLRERVDAAVALAAALAADERALRLPATRVPEPGFVAIAHAWAAGADLETVLEDSELSGGDFVRNVRQLLDLLRQIEQVAAEPATVEAAREAGRRLFRGVVAASAAVRSSTHAGEGVDDDLVDDDVAGREP